MAHITSYPLLRHLRGTSTQHVRHLRGGKVAHDGTGLSFFFRPLSAVISEVPVDDRELPLLFHARTADFQDLTVQASVTFRVTDPATACTRIDFSVDPDTGRWRGTPVVRAPCRSRATPPTRRRNPAHARPRSAWIACPQTISARRWKTCWPPSPRRCAFSSVDRSTSRAPCWPATVSA